MRDPFIVQKTADWILVSKPHGMPSAPLRADEEGTLLSWVLERYPDAAAVRGVKEVECGLIHRLDTATEGLVLIARNQACCDFLWNAQREGLIEKEYYSFCSPRASRELPGKGNYPYRIESRFRAFGPGRREVRPVLPGSRGYGEAGQDYVTIITGATPISDIGALGISCVITKGYRHQIRSHLSLEGCPIIGDELYNPAWADAESRSKQPEVPLQLHAIGITFPDSHSGKTAVFSLPRPDRMTL